jgi:hypothetical protein
MRKKYRGVLIIVMIIFVGILTVFFTNPYFKKINSAFEWKDNDVSIREEVLLEFVNTKLMDENHGIRTNYVDSESEGDITKGHSILSESQGLMLLYYIDRDEKGEFDEVLSYIKDNMLLKSGVISWRIDGGEAVKTDASIDDLRIVKALLLASERWKDISYRALAFKISKGIKKELLDNNLLADFNDGNEKSLNTTICYLDLPTLKILSNLDSEYKPIYKKALELMERAYLGYNVPLYTKVYDRSTDSFDNENVDMLLSSIVLLNRIETGEDVSRSIEWLKEKYSKDGGIFSIYDRNTGTTISKIESTSIYANLFQIAEKLQDEELYNICKDKLYGYQITDVKSEIYGAYGDAITKNVYSFDNLNALLAWRKFSGNK